MKYYSQIGQDKFVDEYLKFKENGVFVDIGAHDGKSCSNTLFFEENRNWNGICIEPGLKEFEDLNKLRKSINIHAWVSDYDGESEFNTEVKQYGGTVNKIKMPVFKLQTILDNHNILNI